VTSRHITASGDNGDQRAITGVPKLRTCVHSSDSSVKYLWDLHDGLSVESISLTVPSRRITWSLSDRAEPQEWRSQRIIGISSQAGCNVQCRFCATGLQPNRRNLTVGEITTQAEHVLGQWPSYTKFGVTFAAMGEPMLNYEAVVASALYIQELPQVDHVTISTSGIVPSINRLADEGQRFGLWISLHATNDRLRDWLIPHNRKYPIEAVLQAGRLYARSLDSRIGISYLLLPGLNDSSVDALNLCSLLEGDEFNVQILLWNEIPTMHFKRASLDQARSFAESLIARGQPAYVMASSARDIAGGCGQLVTDPSDQRIRRRSILVSEQPSVDL
jgi:23S rRNA (adenine2503-C2)-methyltransferase